MSNKTKNQLYVFDVTVHCVDYTHDTYTIVAYDDVSARAKAVKLHKEPAAYCTVEHVRYVDGVAS